MPRQTGYFDHVKARNELSIFKQNARPQQQQQPINRTTAPADSTTDQMLNRKRKSDLKKKLKNRRKKKKRSSSSSSSDDSEDDDELDPTLYDLNTPLFSIAKYIKNPDDMVKEMFRSVEKSKLRNMLSENIKKIETEELKSLCIQQLEGMSKKRIRSILSAQPMEGSSGSESSEDSEDEIPKTDDEDDDDEKDAGVDDEIKPDSTSVGVETGVYEDVSDDEEDPTSTAAPTKEGSAGVDVGGKGGGGKNDIFELEMRARAIRSMLEKKKHKVDATDILAEDEGDLDFLKEFEDDVESPLEDTTAAVEEDVVDPEERKMSVRKLAELKMKAQQEETAVDSSDGLMTTQETTSQQDAAASKPEKKNLQMKQAEILKKAAKLRKKKKKDMVDGGGGGDGTEGFKVNKAKLGQRSFRKRHSSGRHHDDDDDDDRPYSHTYAAYIAAFGDPNMMEYSDSYGASASDLVAWQPRELSVEEEVRALMDELIYRVDPYGAEEVYSFYDTSAADSYGRGGETATEGETLESPMINRHNLHHDYGDGYHPYEYREGSFDPESSTRPPSNNSGQLDFTDDNFDGNFGNLEIARENTTRDNSETNNELSNDDDEESSDEDRLLDGDQLSKVDVRCSRKVNLRLISSAKKRATPKKLSSSAAAAARKVRKVREEKAITLEGLGGGGGGPGVAATGALPVAGGSGASSQPPSSHLYQQSLKQRLHQQQHHPKRPHPAARHHIPPSPLALSSKKISPLKKKKPEEDLEEGELSSEEDDGGVDDEFKTHEAPFTPRETYYARRRMRKSPDSNESSGESSGGEGGGGGGAGGDGETPSRSPTPRDDRFRGDAGRGRRQSRSSSEERQPYQGGYY